MERSASEIAGYTSADAFGFARELRTNANSTDFVGPSVAAHRRTSPPARNAESRKRRREVVCSGATDRIAKPSCRDEALNHPDPRWRVGPIRLRLRAPDPRCESPRAILFRMLRVSTFRRSFASRRSAREGA